MLPADDQLARRTSIPLSALAHRQWVTFDRENGLADIILAACNSASTPFSPESAVITSQVEAAARFASAGIGPALVPQNTIPQGLSGSTLRVEPPLGRELTAYARSGWSPFAAAFVEVMQETAWPTAPEGALIIS